MGFDSFQSGREASPITACATERIFCDTSRISTTIQFRARLCQHAEDYPLSSAYRKQTSGLKPRRFWTGYGTSKLVPLRFVLS